MAIVTLEGVVENGQIRLTDDVTLAERARAFIIIPSGGTEQPICIRSPRLANQEDAAEFAKKVVELPADADFVMSCNWELPE